MDRRAFLSTCAALACAPAWARAAATGGLLAASWQTGDGHQVGILEAGEGLVPRAAIDVPTRAHALLREPGGTLLAIARRPGDWLLRWDRRGRPLAWRWIEPRRAFTGHVLSDGQFIYACETDLDSGAGLIGVRDARTLEKRAEWPTHGHDPHQLAWELGGQILVANGGVSTRPETGRLKRDLEHMDSSLVRLAIDDGALLGQWRLDDARLSLRHMAWNTRQEHLGIALQSEHDDPAIKAAAPVLAVFDGDRLQAAPAPLALAGYGGDVAALAGGFAVGCPRADGVALFTAAGAWRGLLPLAEACALAAAPDRLWVGGRQQALALGGDVARGSLPGIRLDNHWISLA